MKDQLSLGLVSPTAVASAANDTAAGTPRQLVVQCAGDPTKLHALLQHLPAAMRSDVIAEAQQTYGNHFVQTALNPQGAAGAGNSAGGGGSHVTPNSHPHKSQSHVTPNSHPQKSQSHVTPNSHPAGGPNIGTTSFSSSQSVSFMEGPVLVKESVGVSVSHGSGPISFDLSKGSLSVGSEHVNIDLKSAAAVTGKGLSVTGPATTSTHANSTWKSQAKFEDGYVGLDVGSTWTVTGQGANPWTATFSISAFVGTKPKPPETHWWDDIPVVAEVVAGVVAAAGAIAAVGAIIVSTAPEWGPVVLIAAA